MCKLICNRLFVVLDYDFSIDSDFHLVPIKLRNLWKDHMVTGECAWALGVLGPNILEWSLRPYFAKS